MFASVSCVAIRPAKKVGVLQSNDFSNMGQLWLSIYFH